MSKRLLLSISMALLVAASFTSLDVKAQILIRQVGDKPGLSSQFKLNDSQYEKKASPGGNFVRYVKKVKNIDGQFTITPSSTHGEGFRMDLAFVFDPVTRYPVASMVNDNGEMAPFSLPQGKYDAVVSYTFTDEEYREKTYLIIRQGLVVNNDTVWAFSPEDAKNHVTTAIYDENNEVLSPDDGTAGQTIMDCGVYMYDLLAVASFSIWGMVDFYISDVKEADIWATVAVERSGWDNSNNHYYINKIHYLGDITGDFVIMNDKDSYVRHDEYFRLSSQADKDILISHDNITVKSVLFLDPDGLGVSTSEFISTYDDVTKDQSYYETHPVSIFLNNPVAQHDIAENPVNMVARVGVIERVDTVDSIEFDEEIFYITDNYLVWSPYLALDENRNVFYLNEQNALFDTFWMKPGGTYSFNADEERPVLLNNTCQVQMFPYLQTKNYRTAIQSEYMGIYGDFHEMVSKAKLWLNGDLIYEGDSLNAFLDNWAAEGRHIGKHIIETSCTDFRVGDMQGGNTTHYEFDNGGPFETFPHIMMLQFRDDKNLVTPYFDDFNGKVLLSSANVVYDGWQYVSYADCNSTTLSVAPHNTGAWETLPLELTESDARRYGNNFTASLRDIKNVQQGWYDVKIDVETNQGKMTQTLSPAFCIGDPANGIAGVESLDSGVTTYFSIDGRRLPALQKGLNIVRMANGDTFKVMK